jgi:hypothetical protein
LGWQPQGRKALGMVERGRCAGPGSWGWPSPSPEDLRLPPALATARLSLRADHCLFCPPAPPQGRPGDAGPGLRCHISTSHVKSPDPTADNLCHWRTNEDFYLTVDRREFTIRSFGKRCFHWAFGKGPPTRLVTLGNPMVVLALRRSRRNQAHVDTSRGIFHRARDGERSPGGLLPHKAGGQSLPVCG